MLIYLSSILNTKSVGRSLCVGILALFFLGVFTPTTFAQEATCDRTFLEQWTTRPIVKRNTPVAFDAPVLPSGATLETQLLNDQTVLFSSKEPSFTYSFTTTGVHSILMQVTTSPICTTGVTHTITVYDRLLTYLGTPLPDIDIMKPELAKQGVGVMERFEVTEAWQNVFARDSYLLTDADIILINSAAVGSIFDAIELSLHEKTIYTTAPLSQSSFRRIASRYQNTLGITQLSVIKPAHINILLSALAFGKDLSEVDVVQTFSVTADNQVRQSPVSYAIDYLLYSGFPLSMLTWMLLLPCLAILLSATRQIIGISVFGIFNPLMLGLSLHIAGIWPTLIMLGCGVITTLLVRLFTKHIFLLYSAKVALTLTVYMLGVIFAFALYAYYGGVTPETPNQWEVFVSPSGLFCCLFLLLVARQVFSPKTSFSDQGRWVGLGEFVLVSLGVYWFIESLRIQNTLLGYPEITLLFIILSVMIGRFSGLQLVEYIRFMPVIKHYLGKK